jgi:hypothetical protein
VAETFQEKRKREVSWGTLNLDLKSSSKCQKSEVQHCIIINKRDSQFNTNMKEFKSFIAVATSKPFSWVGAEV